MFQFSRMIQIIISSKDKAVGSRAVDALENMCRAILTSDPTFKRNVIVMGPVEAPFAKIARATGGNTF